MQDRLIHPRRIELGTTLPKFQNSRVLSFLVSRSKQTWWKDVWSMPGKPGVFLGWPATIFILSQALAGIPLFFYALFHWDTANPLRFACFMAVALSASIFKVRLPGIQATMSA